jgi:hypothetical protein
MSAEHEVHLTPLAIIPPPGPELGYRTVLGFSPRDFNSIVQTKPAHDRVPENIH